jgi:broad specificity phosphatase PhoE
VSRPGWPTILGIRKRQTLAEGSNEPVSESPLLYFARHGETDANRGLRYSGWSDDPLNAVGRAQCIRLADEIESLGVDHIFTSPVRRAVETAQIVATRLGADVRTVHDLHEIELGPWKGLTEGEVASAFPDAYLAWKQSPHTMVLEGRETLDAVQERALRAADQIGHAQLSAGAAPAVVVTHLAVLRVLWLHASGRSLSGYHAISGPNCRVFALRWLGRGKLETAGPGPDED